MKTCLRSLLLLPALLFPAPGLAERITLAEAGFSLIPPPGWILEQTDNAPTSRYTFAAPSRRGNATPPYMSIHLAPSAPPTPAELDAMPHWPADQTETKRSAAELARPGTMLYEAKTGIIWSTTSFSLPHKGRVQGLSGTRVTRDGLLHASAYAWESDFDRYSAEFETTIRSIELGPELRPATLNPMNLMQALLPLVMMAIVLYLYRRRRKFCKHGLPRQ